MTNIQFAPETPPGFRRVRRGQPVCCARYPLPKTKNSADLVHYFLGRGQFIFYFLIFAILFYFSAQGGGHGPRGPPLATSLLGDECVLLEVPPAFQIAVVFATYQDTEAANLLVSV